MTWALFFRSPKCGRAWGKCSQPNVTGFLAKGKHPRNHVRNHTVRAAELLFVCKAGAPAEDVEEGWIQQLEFFKEEALPTHAVRGITTDTLTLQPFLGVCFPTKQQQVEERYIT